DAADASLIIIDECSMVDEELGRDLLSFGTPILVLGDPAQLPPVKGGGFFTDSEPDIMLTEVHRQASDNPIIAMSMTIREGGFLEHGVYGDSQVVTRGDIDSDDILEADQVLIGMNRTRRLFNKRIRTLKEFIADTPMAGDKLVCLRNERAKGLLNGGLWTVRRAHAMKRGRIKLEISPEDDETRRMVNVSVMPEMFDGRDEDIPYAKRRNADDFDYGYALTVHKSQGSQWNNVVLFDESGAFREHSQRWLYTAITRAAERITIVK
ncbi:MAG: ATP-binding domain-containing protein, partial [Cohaesibacteraceae bacterium]|nr:ATP-binding domain-containing protein [Cohaesibacteraceae bacterium]